VTVSGSGSPAAQTQYGYDSVGNALSKTEKCSYNGLYNCPDAVTNYAYDSYGNVLNVKDPNGHFTYYSYADQFTDCSPAQATNAYPTRVTYPPTYGGVPHIEMFTYNYHSSHMTSSTDENGQTSNYLYTVSGQPEPFARLTEMDSPDGGKTLISYDDNPTTNTTDQNPHPSVTTTKIRDSNPGDNIVSLSVMDGLAHVVQTQIKSAPEGTNFVETAYDGLARVLTVTNPHLSGSSPSDGTTCYGTWSNGHCAGIGYDALGRVLTITHPDLSVLTSKYTGRATEVIDEGNGSGTNVTRISQSDALGHLRLACEVTTKTLPAGGDANPTSCGLDIAGTGFLTSYQYDALGNLLDVHQSSQQQDRQFTYDGLSRVITASNPESGTTSYSYDLNGNITSRTRPAPNQPNPAATVTTNYTYDSLNRLNRKTYSDGVTPEVDLVYDQAGPNFGGGSLNVNGRLAYAFEPNSTMDVYSYDVMGRVTDSWQCVAMPCSSAWDAHETYDWAGDRLTLGYNTAATLTYSYDSAQRMTGVTGSGLSNLPSPLLSGVGYGPVGLLNATLGANPGSLPEVRVYNPRTFLSSLLVGGGSVYSLSLTYWGDGDVDAANDNVNGNWTYVYDDFNRLAQATNTTPSPNQIYTYAYDRFGNRWQQNYVQGQGSGWPMSLTFNGNNQVTMTGYVYDAAGNVVMDFQNCYAYDAENRLSSVAAVLPGIGSCGATKVTYGYDPDGRRVIQNGTTVRWDYYDSAGTEIAETNASGTLLRAEIYAGARHLATWTNASGGATYFNHNDVLGTERVRTFGSGSNAGKQCETITSLPFGDGLATHDQNGGCGGSGADPSPNHFTGLERDAESGLDHTLNRQFASTYGRWLTPDPAGVKAITLADPQTWNMYEYAHNNPTTVTDPSGLMPVPTPSSGGAPTDPFECMHVVCGSGDLDELDPLPAGETAQKQATTPQQQPFNPTIVYDNDLAPRELAVAKDKVGAAVRLINSKWSKLSDKQRTILGLMKTIRVFGGSRGGIDPQTLIFNLSFRDNVESSPIPRLASDIAHDSFHIFQWFTIGPPTRADALSREPGATRFQIGVGRILGLSQDDIRFFEDAAAHPERYWRFEVP